ncbi:M48 family metalloprotease [Sphingomonas sp. LT1P40]|uniref:M48 family metalloprotease n=1 Tax=Alteristakelama amylovorans TaxID=3096166 RepID=UPI002FCAC8DF
MALGTAAVARAQGGDAALFEAIRAADMVLATTGFELSTANAPLCDRLEPGLGIQLHTLAQYDVKVRESVRGHFRFAGSVAVEGVVPGSPAAAAGVRQDDTVVSIGGLVPAEPPSGAEPTAQLASYVAAIALLPSDQPVKLVLSRAGARIELTVRPVPACRSRYELRIANMFDTRANGEMVQITSKYIDEYGVERVRGVVAHELAHNILRHRERLAAAGLSFGIASGFGRNVGYFRQAEIQADILSAHLLVRAGYDANAAAQFWRDAGPALLGLKIRSRSHPAFKDRAATIEAEAVRIAASGGVATPPAFLADRDKPLDGKWQPLLVRAR